MGKKVEIALTVQASSLYAMSNPSQQDIDTACSLSDDNSGRSSNGTLKDFLSNVYLNQDVKWIGISTDRGFSVAIDSIFNEPETRDVNFFDVETIYGTGGRSGNATAKVKNDSNLVHKHDKYTITFSVYADGNSSKSFHIDPKLAANP
ncbi:hypothetical protein [Flavobacterium sandaracinum]|uniref:Uncharacterized protein n=1 Tax=Flavobacterium sandaracinum TaxID=2541733 RepID=A0A4R5D419_9FLAO|nr:hypothetical protein [Flavobacterium sandaracinum]TDE07197.1 hypothetical protein E0F91_02600 [Flavobacterium sandaracinum]